MPVTCSFRLLRAVGWGQAVVAISGNRGKLRARSSRRWFARPTSKELEMSVLIDTGRLDLGSARRPCKRRSRARPEHTPMAARRPGNVLARLEYWQLNRDVTFLHQVSSSVSRTRTLMKYGLKGGVWQSNAVCGRAIMCPLGRAAVTGRVCQRGWPGFVHGTCSGSATPSISRLMTIGSWPLRVSTHSSGWSSRALISWCGTNGGT